MIKYFLLIFFLFNFSAAFSSSHRKNIEGEYQCKGFDPYSNSTYQGRGVIKKTGDTYACKWDFGKGMQYLGTGIYDPNEQSIGIIFVNPDDSKEKGVLIYHIENDGTLKDNWTYYGKTKVGHGICKKLSNN